MLHSACSPLFVSFAAGMALVGLVLVSLPHTLFVRRALSYYRPPVHKTGVGADLRPSPTPALYPQFVRTAGGWPAGI